MFLDATATIDRLSQNLLDLKNDFDSGLAVQTAVVSFRTHQDLATLGA